MESRTFIAQAQNLITKIAAGVDERDTTQRELNNLLAGLQNPTLPSAARLVSVAHANGYTVRQEVLHRLQQAENCWS